MCDDTQQTLQWMSDTLEAAEADVQQWMDALEVTRDRLAAAEKQLAEAQARITELERLVPDADRLDYMADEQELWLKLEGAIPRQPGWEVAAQWRTLAAAIREYKKDE